MYLEKLEIYGFKSFANKNRLEFSSKSKDGKKGITAIVGPNGSGKSNIADAVRWVLGEQSAKTLRGKKGEDIIFSGSDKKSRLAMAEVSLYLRNDKKDKKEIKPEKGEVSPFDYDQLIITRRITRNGESQYLINNNRVRLIDIQILLAKANIGQKTYSIIGQGLVENFLNTSAAEKKEFFDEATGVRSFQIKRDAALNKLERSYENLEQVNMLLSEISPRLKTLTRQVEKINKRDKLETNLKNSQHIYYHFFYKKYSTKLDKLNQEILELEDYKNQKEKDLAIVLEENKKFSQVNIKPEEDKLKQELKEYQNTKDQLVKKQAQLQAEISLNLENQGKFDLAWLNTKKDELKNKRNEIENQIEEEKPKNLIEEEEKLKKDWQKIQEKTSQLEKDRQTNIEAENEINHLKEKLIRIDTILESMLEKRKGFDLENFKNQERDLSEKINEINNFLNNFNLSSYNEKNKKLEAKLEIINNSLKEEKEKLKNFNQEIEEKSKQGIGKRTINQEIKSFLANLETIEKENDLKRVQELLFKARNDFKNKIKELVGFDEEELLEKIKNTQEDIIILNEKRQNIQNELNENKWLLSQKESEYKDKENQKEKLSSELLVIKKERDQVLNDENFRSIKKEKNEILETIEEKKENIKNININTISQSLNHEKEELMEKLNNCRFKISSKEEKIKILEQNYINLKREIEDIEDKINRSKYSPSVDKLKQEKNIIEEKITKIEEKINSIKNSLQEHEKERQSEKKQMISNQEKADELRVKLEKNNNHLHNIELEATKLETRLEDLEETIKNNNLNIIDIKKEPKFEDNNLENTDYEDLFKKINNYKKQLEQIGSLDPETENEYKKTKERHDFLSQQTSDLSETISSLEKIISQLDEQIKTRFEKEFNIIANKFNSYFKILFGGGQAKIIKQKENQEEENEEDNRKKWKKRGALGLSGIDIQAVPPGKKIQSIAMLSGGERALTAIALICAIINVNPSPFVVLDEVDAALDEANSEKLAKILDDLSNKTQFIIITHNRATMRKAEVLYGTTMQSDGVSRLLSIKLEEAIKIEDKK